MRRPKTRTEAAEELADRYLVLWNEPDADRRRRTITELWTEDGRHILQPPQEIRGIAARPGIGLAAILEARGYEETEARGASAYEHWVGSEGSASGGATTPSPHHAAKRLFVACDRKETSMAHRDTAEVIKRFNDSFLERDAAKLVDLVADDCVMESAEPAPNGIRYEGYDACLCFWQELIADPEGSFEPEDVLVSGDRATIRWRYRFGEGEESSVRGVTLMHVRDGKIVEALGYLKAGLRSAPAS